MVADSLSPTDSVPPNPAATRPNPTSLRLTVVVPSTDATYLSSAHATTTGQKPAGNRPGASPITGHTASIAKTATSMELLFYSQGTQKLPPQIPNLTRTLILN